MAPGSCSARMQYSMQWVTQRASRTDIGARARAAGSGQRAAGSGQRAAGSGSAALCANENPLALYTDATTHGPSPASRLPPPLRFQQRAATRQRRALTMRYWCCCTQLLLRFLLLFAHTGCLLCRGNCGSPSTNRYGHRSSLLQMDSNTASLQ